MAATVFCIFVIGNDTSMYTDVLYHFLYFASPAGLQPPGPPDARAAQGQAAQYSAILLDFELAEHTGLYRALLRAFGGSPADYLGRVVGFRVHLQRFLSPKCGNDVKDDFYKDLMQMRDADAAITYARMQQNPRAIFIRHSQERERYKINCLKWLVDHESAAAAAFPACAGRLAPDTIRATGKNTNATEPLNKTTQDIVADTGDRSLLGAVMCLMSFEKERLAEISPSNMLGRNFSTISAAARKVHQLTRQAKREVVPSGGAPPGPARSTKRKNATAPIPLP